jgi:hypothetical protein
LDKRIRIEGFNVITMTLDIVARATIYLEAMGCPGSWTRESGSMAHTSPRLPEKMHLQRKHLKWWPNMCFIERCY